MKNILEFAAPEWLTRISEDSPWQVLETPRSIMFLRGQAIGGWRYLLRGSQGKLLHCVEDEASTTNLPILNISVYGTSVQLYMYQGFAYNTSGGCLKYNSLPRTI